LLIKLNIVSTIYFSFASNKHYTLFGAVKMADNEEGIKEVKKRRD